MGKATLRKSVFACAILAAGHFTTQNVSAQGDQEQKKIVRVCSLNSIQANQEFQRNVQLLQAQRQRVIELKSQIDNSNDSSEKKTVQVQLDEMLGKLNENNQVMFKTYGFSLTRNYTMVVEKSHIYMMVSDEEAKRFESMQAETGGAGK